MNRLYKNNEVKNITVKFILLQAIVLLSAYLIFTQSVNNLNRSYIENNKVLASRLIALAPSTKEEIIKAFTKDISLEEIKSSEAVLSDYGYRNSLELYKNPIIYRFYNSTALVMICFLIIIGLLAYMLTIREFSKVFNKIRSFAQAAEEIVEGKFQKAFPDDREGDFYILGHQFNMMSKRLKESLDKLKEEKVYLKTIIADISHQLKTPLAALLMFNGIMESEESMDWQERKAFLKRSSEQLFRMEWLIKNLLKLARLEAGAVEFDMEDNMLDFTIEKSINSLELMAEEKRQAIKVKANKPITFKHDTEWTTEALINIIKNSIEHTKEGGLIEIDCEETPLSVQIRIRDNGDGIKKSETSKIFKRFYKGENSTNPASIGIGLALSKSIIEGQGGSITVTSELGKGTVFSITFLKTVI